MKDPIERQDAIDALDVLCQEHRYKIPGKRETYSQYNEAWQDALDRAEGAIFNLPSAQPKKRTQERTETHACDLIERQAAIDALHMHLMYRMGTDSNKKRLDEWINNLPSAQPEIIRCKDCKHFHYDMPYVIQGIPVLGHEVCDFWGDGCKTSENGFCSYAERKTDEQRRNC